MVITDKQLQKLLELAETKKEEPKDNVDEKEVLAFVEFMGIKKGRTLVPGYLVYYYYYHWSKKKKLSRVKFFRHFIKMFARKITKYEYLYLLNGDPFDLTPTGRFKARALIRHEKEKHKKRKDSILRDKKKLQSQE